MAVHAVVDGGGRGGTKWHEKEIMSLAERNKMKWSFV